MRFHILLFVFLLLEGCPRPTPAPTCSDCRVSCELPKAAGVVEEGRCVVAQCEFLYGDCNEEPSDGCETPLSTLENCGGCGTTCTQPPAPVCVGSLRQVFLKASVCSSGKCEYHSVFETCAQGCSNGECLPSQCGDTETNPNHCGACNVVCNFQGASSVCRSGSCALGTCLPHLGNCDSLDSNGCETPLNSTSHCGACNLACPQNGDAGDYECREGRCELTSCPVGLGNCDGLSANGCETALDSMQHCGACNNACPGADAGAYECKQGSCQLAPCPEAFDNCDGDVVNGCETSLATLSNCGRCGNICRFDHLCSQNPMTNEWNCVMNPY